MKLPVSEDWRAQVRERLAARGERKKMADAIGKSQAAITQLLSPDGPKTSDLVLPISARLGLPIPAAHMTAEQAEWSDILMALSPQRREALLNMGRVMAHRETDDPDHE